MTYIVVQEHAFFESEADLQKAIQHCASVAKGCPGKRIYLAQLVLYREYPPETQPPSPPEKGGAMEVGEAQEYAILGRAA